MLFKEFHAFIPSDSLEPASYEIFLPIHQLIHFCPNHIQIRDIDS